MTTIEQLKTAFASIGMTYKGSQFGQLEWHARDNKRGVTADWNGSKWCLCELDVKTGRIIGSFQSVEEVARRF
jgi:hypothetical protein